MKKAIFTLAIGDNPMYRAAIKSFEIYAKKVGADLIVSDSLHYPIKIENPLYNASPAWTEKLRIGALLEEYDRVLYVDADVLITPTARDVFELYPDTSKAYWFNEGVKQERAPDIAMIQGVLGEVNWPERDSRPVYYNAGIILTSKQCPLFKKTDLDDLQEICNRITHYDQSYFNYTLHKHNISHESLDKSFNRMDMFGHEDYLKADFIHYAGKGYAKNNRRRDVQFIRDFAQLYSDVVDEIEIKALKEHAWTLYLEKIHKKYPLPDFFLTQLCKWFVPR
ncbi:glycosyltransferase family 8 protein [Pseudoalteromonas rubra]|uniref:Glycosyl transferase n=1 Tax=Pseudoalteromonas rubra TaxID=43658 RepID=A0A5S3X2B2_9GAMM|nr:glycosyltransferase family 8 protein [Pseudoalteromonas rubra]TMP37821.1 glycosyl transferase [Pseudoalteromonas rubra]